MKKCTFHGHAQLFSSQSLRLMELLRYHDSHTFHHSVQTTSYFIDFCLHHHFQSLLKPRILQSVLLHDIGNLLIAKELLSKNGPLTFSEKNELEQHPELGLELLSDYPEIEIEPSLIVHHHENRDGTGYPDRMESDQLPFVVKILRMIDSYTAMTMDRPYRPKHSVQSAVDEIIQNHYVDASCTSLFVTYMEKRLKGKRVLLHYLDYVPNQK